MNENIEKDTRDMLALKHNIIGGLIKKETCIISLKYGLIKWKK